MTISTLLKASETISAFQSMLITLAVVAVILVIAWLCLKYKTARIIVGTMIATACIVAYSIFTVYSTVTVFTYYKAHGVIFGGINEVPKLPKNDLVIDVDNLTFDFTNISLTEVSEGYSANITTNDVLELENKKHTILVNGTPADKCENSTDYIMGYYTYTFYNANKEENLTDTLKISIALNGLNTSCTLHTSGSGEAVKHWNYYFAKNGFTVTLISNGYVEGDIWGELATELTLDLQADALKLEADLMNLQTTSKVDVLKAETYLENTLVTNAQLNAHNMTISQHATSLNGYELEYNNCVTRLNNIKENYSKSLSVNSELASTVADIEKSLQVSQTLTTNIGTSVNGCLVALSTRLDENTISVTYMVDETVYHLTSVEKYYTPEEVPAPTKDGYSFVGWSADKENVVIPHTVPLTADTVYHAIFA